MYGYQVVFYGCAVVFFSSRLGIDISGFPETKGTVLTSHMAGPEDEKPLAGDESQH
jgi:hypothetical protein